MNLIQQLQQTSKWKEFEEWYNKNPNTFIPFQGNYQLHYTFVEFPFEFQKGVFEKFIENKGYHLCSERRKNGSGLVIVPVLYRIPKGDDVWSQCLVNDNCDTFEELLIWYFNN